MPSDGAGEEVVARGMTGGIAGLARHRAWSQGAWSPGQTSLFHFRARTHRFNGLERTSAMKHLFTGPVPALLAACLMSAPAAAQAYITFIIETVAKGHCGGATGSDAEC